MLESLKKKAEINPKDVALSKRKERKEKRLSLEQKITHPRKGRGKAKKTRRKKKGRWIFMLNCDLLTPRNGTLYLVSLLENEKISKETIYSAVSALKLFTSK